MSVAKEDGITYLVTKDIVVVGTVAFESHQIIAKWQNEVWPKQPNASIEFLLWLEDVVRQGMLAEFVQEGFFDRAFRLCIHRFMRQASPDGAHAQKLEAATGVNVARPSSFGNMCAVRWAVVRSLLHIDL